MSESTSELAVHLAAAAQGVDAAQLCDSAAFMGRVEGLRPDSPGFINRVSEAVREAAQTNPSYRRAAEPAAPAPVEDAGTAQEAPGAPLSRNEQVQQRASRRAALTADRPAEQITVQDVQDADPRVVNSWATAGKLSKFGIAVKQHR
ncbi:hypothetical protein ACFTZF_01165 [Streptomyces mirabilis]|uniref:hypothetical protein n=1 Tax=Streptomyces mirabilis TaxID=68239 RepID=UPI00363C3987